MGWGNTGMKFRGLSRRATTVVLVLASVAGFSAGAMAQTAQPTILEYPQTALKGFVSAEFRRGPIDCQRICEQRSGCAGFDYSSTTNMCRLFAAVQSGQGDPSFLAGTRSKIPGYRDPVNLAPPPEQEQWYYAHFSNVDLFGGDMIEKGIEMRDGSLCQRKCEQDTSCRAFTFNSEQDRCFLKSGYQFVQSVNGVESGLYFHAKPSESRVNLTAEWQLFLKSDLPGNDLIESTARSYPQCLRDCENNNSCGGFTWVYFTRQDHCYLKYGTSLYPSRNDKGVVSARKFNQEIMPDFIRPVSSRD